MIGQLSVFRGLVSSVLIPLCAYLLSRRVTSRGIALVDSLPLKVFHNYRIPRHSTFAEVTARGKNSADWYDGFTSCTLRRRTLALVI